VQRAWPQTAAAQETKIALGMSGWTGFAPLSLADKAGIFKKNGLDVELKMIPQKDRHLALASGAIQCAATTVETHVAWNANGVPIVQIFRRQELLRPQGQEHRRGALPAPRRTSAWPGCSARTA
jgi:ABC-type nitrate/sulfonate/bicarbonate transport system substrate-binding protein